MSALGTRGHDPIHAVPNWDRVPEFPDPPASFPPRRTKHGNPATRALTDPTRRSGLKAGASVRRAPPSAKNLKPPVPARVQGKRPVPWRLTSRAVVCYDTASYSGGASAAYTPGCRARGRFCPEGGAHLSRSGPNLAKKGGSLHRLVACGRDERRAVRRSTEGKRRRQRGYFAPPSDEPRNARDAKHEQRFAAVTSQEGKHPCVR